MLKKEDRTAAHTSGTSATRPTTRITTCLNRDQIDWGNAQWGATESLTSWIACARTRVVPTLQGRQSCAGRVVPWNVEQLSIQDEKTTTTNKVIEHSRLTSLLALDPCWLLPRGSHSIILQVLNEATRAANSQRGFPQGLSMPLCVPAATSALQGPSPAPETAATRSLGHQQVRGGKRAMDEAKQRIGLSCRQAVKLHLAIICRPQGSRFLQRFGWEWELNDGYASTEWRATRELRKHQTLFALDWDSGS